MKNIRIVLLSTLLLLPAARVWAQAYDAAQRLHQATPSEMKPLSQLLATTQLRGLARLS
jgi:hypothetical protein